MPLYPYAYDHALGRIYWLEVSPFLEVLRLADMWHTTPSQVEQELPIYRTLALIDKRVTNNLDQKEQENAGEDNETGDQAANIAMRSQSEAERMKQLLNPNQS